MNSNQLKIKLKKDFFGIEEQISEICNAIAPWHEMPDSYIRPLIVNIWGPTGVGKTTLIRKIARYLKVPIIELDMGEFIGDSNNNFSMTFFEKYYDFSTKPCIILIDEIHIAKTVDKSNDIERHNLRGLWSLLSDGTIVINDKSTDIDQLTHDLDMAEKKYIQYERAKQRILDSGRGEIFKENKNNFKNLVAADEDDDDFFPLVVRENKDKQTEEERIVLGIERDKMKCFRWDSEYWFKTICKLVSLNFYDTRDQLNKDFLATLKIIRKKIRDIGTQPQLDFTHSMIVVSGNLDTLYSSVKDFDPDLDLDTLYDESKELTVSDIKQVLAELFRTEQIGRFGNNHVIYNSLRKNDYRNIIKNDLKRISKYFTKTKKFCNSLKFDKSIIDIIYKEGVVPAQGARSVLSTIGCLLEPSVINGIVEWRKNKKQGSIGVSYNYETRTIDFDSKNYHKKYDVKLKFDELRKPIFTEKSASIAIHEAGHILVSVFAINSIPRRASAFGVGQSDGLVESIFDKDCLYNYNDIIGLIKVCLGGVVAEKIIFGKKNESGGSSNDIEKATAHAFGIINSGRNSSNLVVSVARPDDSEHSDVAIKRHYKHDKLVKDIIRTAYAEVQKLIENNLEFLKSLANELLTNSMIFDKDILRIMRKHNIKLAEKFSYRTAFKKFMAPTKIS